MATDHVLVVGPTAGDPPPRPPPPRTGLVAVAALATLVAGLWLAGREATPPGPADPSELAPPEEPPPTPPGPIPDPTPALATGWERLDLIGTHGVTTAIAHGPDGWLVAVPGERSLAYTSPDAGTWRVATLPAGIHPGSAAVADGVMAVVGWFGEDPGASAAVSVDGGSTWVEAPISPEAGFYELVAAGAGIYAVGAEGPSAGSWGTASIHRLDGVEWTGLDFAHAPGADSVVHTVVEGPDGLVAFGRADHDPAAWSIHGDLAGRRPLDLVDVTDDDSGFIGVVPVGSGGWVGALGRFESGIGLVVESDDLTTWRRTEWSGVLARSLASVGGSPVLLAQNGFSYLDGDWVRVRTDMPGIDTGLEDAEHLSGIAGDDRGQVLVGLARSRSVAWVRAGREPSVAFPRPPAGEGRWEALARYAIGVASQSLDVTSHDGEAIVATAAGMFRIPDPEEEPERVQATGARRTYLTPFSTPEGLFAAAGADLYRYEGDGTWEREQVPFTEVWVVTAVDGRVRAAGVGLNGIDVVVAERSESGTWAVVGDPERVAWFVREAPGGFLGVIRGTAGFAFSPDGISWRPVEGAATFRGSPALVLPHPNGWTVRLLEDGTDGREVTVPGPAPVDTVTAGDRVLVRSSHAVHVFDAGGSRHTLPLDVEHGFLGETAVLVPSSRPTIAALEGSRLVIYGWRPCERDDHVLTGRACRVG